MTFFFCALVVSLAHCFSRLPCPAIHANRVTILKKDVTLILNHFRPDVKQHVVPAIKDMSSIAEDENDDRVARMLRRRVTREEWLKKDAEKRTAKKKK